MYPPLDARKVQSQENRTENHSFLNVQQIFMEVGAKVDEIGQEKMAHGYPLGFN